MWEARHEFERRSASLLAVGGSAPYQAEWLATDVGIGMPLALDPDQTLRAEVEFGDLSVRQVLFNPTGVKNYLRSLREGGKIKRITSDTVRSPGVVILDADRQVKWRHEGEYLGDYPEVSDVLRAIDELET